MNRATTVLLRGLAAAALGVVAGVHLHLAPGYTLVGDQVTQGGLFRVQAGLATAVALALLARPVRLVWLAAATVGLGSVLAVVVTVYVAVPAIGPLPRIFEPIWYGEKVVAAVAAGAALVTSLAGFVLTLRDRRSHAARPPAQPPRPGARRR